MKQCLRITFTIDKGDNFLDDFIHKHAKKLRLEGVAQMLEPKKVQVIVHGPEDQIDEFVELLYKGSAKAQPKEIEIEPLLKECNYRGVFRVIQ